MRRSTIEILPIGLGHEEALAKFFALLRSRGVDEFFHPHPFTAQAARERAAYAGDDLYFGLFEDGAMLGYGMLRGWDEGYEIPSLGIVVHPDSQGQGLGRLLMTFLKAAAMRRGAKQIRLRVYPDNHTAVKLYRALGYELSAEKDSPYLIGFLDLSRPGNMS
jgi:ribosomal-protein-alanine N-acetyltransferase